LLHPVKVKFVEGEACRVKGLLKSNEFVQLAEKQLKSCPSGLMLFIMPLPERCTVKLKDEPAWPALTHRIKQLVTLR